MSSYHDLPVPLRDCATLECDEIHRIPRVSVTVRLWGGNRDAEGVFTRDPELAPQMRSIVGDEFVQFCAWVESLGREVDQNSGVLYTDHDVLVYLANREYAERGITLPEAP
jgi:hypothetical protein